MKFSTILALVASPLLALAQTENPFNIPTTGLNTEAGETVTLEWEPTTTGTISLILRNGAASDLNPGEAIAQNIPNSGSFTWSVPDDIIRGSDYAIEIRPSGGTASESNYTPQFVIESTNNAVRTSTGTASTGTATTASTGSSTTTGSTATNSSAPTTSSTQTNSSSSTGTSSRPTTTNTSTNAGFQGATTTTSTGSAPRATAAAGMMGLVALGAMAL